VSAQLISILIAVKKRVENGVSVEQLEEEILRLDFVLDDVDQGETEQATDTETQEEEPSGKIRNRDTFFL
jgi:hypothetical protein